MATDSSVPRHFSVNLAQLKLVGAGNTLSPKAVQLADLYGLCTEDRLFLGLWQNNSLDAAVFNPGDRIAVRGDRVHSAYVVVSGDMKASDQQNSFTLGSGSVIGLAEGMGNLPHALTITATTTVKTRIIHIGQARQVLLQINTGLRGIFRTAIARTLGLTEIPENLK